jgi:hypothetical protein
MGRIGPPRSFEELEDSARVTRLGKAEVPLHGVASDALEMDRKTKGKTQHFATNRKLAKAISDVLEKEKLDKGNLDENGKPLFVLAWRLYPNRDSGHWQENHAHTCGCGCSCAAPRPRPKPRPKPRRKRR